MEDMEQKASEIINIFKDYWFYGGEWHDAECDFILYDWAVCNCNHRKNLNKIKDLLKLTN